MPTLMNKTIRGAGWMALAQVMSQAIRIVFMVVLARLILPSEFGLWTMVMVLTGFVTMLSDIGLGAALIQMPSPGQRILSTAFWVNSALGLFLSAVMAVAAEPLSHVYGEVLLAPFIMAASAEFAIKGLVAVHRVLFIREMDFRTLALSELGGVFVGGLLACGMASAGFGTWCFVAQQLVTSAVIALWMFVRKPWRPSLVIDRAGLRKLLSFGLHLQGFNLINYWLRNLDKLLIGRLLGETMLGHYNRAYTTMLLPQSQVTGVLERVMWPALARCASDPEKLRDAYLHTLRILSFVMFPCMAGLAGCSREFILALFGPNWEPSVASLQWLCVAGFVQGPVSTTGWLYLATGRTRRMMAWAVIAAAFTVPAMLVGAWSGSIEGMSAWYAASAVLLAPGAFAMVASTASLRLLDVIRSLAGSGSAAILMGIIVYATSIHLPDVHHALRLALLTLIGIVVYGSITWKMKASVETRQVIRASIALRRKQHR